MYNENSIILYKLRHNFMNYWIHMNSSYSFSNSTNKNAIEYHTNEIFQTGGKGFGISTECHLINIDILSEFIRKSKILFCKFL